MTRAWLFAAVALIALAGVSAQDGQGGFDLATEEADVISPESPLPVNEDYKGPSPVKLPIDALEQVQTTAQAQNAGPEFEVVESTEQVPLDASRCNTVCKLNRASRLSECQTICNKVTNPADAHIDIKKFAEGSI